MNKTISVGNLTDDPKVYQTATGKKYVRFTLALKRMKEGADFPRFIAWEKKAEIIEKWCNEGWCGKGSRMLVEGHLQTGNYESENGKVYTTDIVCDNIEFLDRKPKDGTEGQPKENPSDEFMMIPDGLGEEVPFK